MTFRAFLNKDLQGKIVTLYHTKHSQTMATVQEYLLLKFYTITNPPVLSLISLTWEHIHIHGQGFLNKTKNSKMYNMLLFHLFITSTTAPLLTTAVCEVLVHVQNIKYYKKIKKHGFHILWAKCITDWYKKYLYLYFF